MKFQYFLSKWSRKIHRWVGLYFAVIVLLYLSEFLILPMVYSEGLPTIDGTPPPHEKINNHLLSLEQSTQQFIEQHPSSINTIEEINAISYLPNSGLYRFEDSDRYFEWYIDAQTGKLLKYGFKTDLFLEEKGILGWLNPLLHNILEFPMLLLLVSLAISGIYLFLNPFLTKKNR